MLYGTLSKLESSEYIAGKCFCYYNPRIEETKLVNKTLLHYISKSGNIL